MTPVSLIKTISIKTVDIMINFKHLFDNGKVIYSANCYGNNDLEILDKTEEGESIRLLLVNGTRESATYNKKEYRNDLVFRYSICFNEVFTLNRNLNDCLLIGGAGFSYPKYFISHYPDKRLDVVEIDGEMVKLAFKYFYLDELFSDYNLYENERLKIYVMDGEEYLISTTKTYDVIFNDAYVSDKPAEGLITFEAVSLVKKHLNPNGVYVINIITAVSGKAAYPLFSELAYVKQIFKYTELYKCRDDVPANEKQNCLIFASDMPFK